ncbi:hypothetical protein PENTCL1PPCAC_5639 [Pristionchus entomophagus]|uniref:Uncharacterized protein n=1 Tax=Pristionchus entomophagus TaxID=358040 RepID=A0AAV5SKL7_9BILA|nr:hypothetical protein PENTCL1PPCAC_5639 [Pristionchus entomophagus]
MISCRVVASLLLSLLTYDHSTAIREVGKDEFAANLAKWTNLTAYVGRALQNKKHNKSLSNPFQSPGFLTKLENGNIDGSAVLLSAKNVTPDLELTEHFSKMRGMAPCMIYKPPSKNYKRAAVPLFTIAVFANVTTDEKKPYKKFEPYICALRQQTEMIIFIDISQSVVGPPKGDVCNTMILIRQSLHSALFLATIFSETTNYVKPILCRPIVWGNLSPYLQIRMDTKTQTDNDTLVFLATKGGSINFAIEGDIHFLDKISEKNKKRMLANLYAVFDNTCQLAHKSDLGGRENYLTGPRFAFSNVELLKKKYMMKRRELRDYLVSEGQDLSTIVMLSILPVLLFAGTVTMCLHINPQRIPTDYEKIIDLVEPDPEPESKREKKGGVLEAIKNLPKKIASETYPNVSQGERKKKIKRKKNKDKAVTEKAAEVTAEAEVSAKTGRGTESKKVDDKTAKQKKSKGEFGSIGIKKLRKRKTQQERASDDEVTATTDTVTGTEATALATTALGN